MAGNNTTICAIATPPGRGGIGIIRISGPAALDIARQMTGIEPAPRQAHYCSFNDTGGRPIDDGVLLYFRAPASFTGEDVVELQAHGGRVVLNMLQNRITDLGAVLARPGEFTERAFLNNRIDLLQAEAVADLIDSVSEQAARSAIRSLQGEFSKRIGGLFEELVNLRVFVEGALDFPDEEIDFLADDRVLFRIEALQAETARILGQAHSGRILNEGIQIAIVGRPNVGKSSLLNRLSRSERAIVTAQPGTTRDVIEDRILIRGIAVTVADTAGIRETRDTIELEGIRRAISESNQADLVVLVTEHGNSTADLEYVLAKIQGGTRLVVVENKIDLADAAAGTTIDDDGLHHVRLSAKTGEGMDLLEDLIVTMFIGSSGEENVILARQRHLDALQQLARYLDQAQAAAVDRKHPELLAAELVEAQRTLGTITGEFVADDLLGEIFSRFCIGK